MGFVHLSAQSVDSVVVKELQKEGVSFSHNNAVTLLTTGQEKFDDLFLCIQQAKKSVHLEYFNFRNDSIANALFSLLAQKVKEGVQVKALFDDFGNMSNNRPLKKDKLEKLRRQGIEIYAFDPIRFPWINHVWSRDHRKIVVIDGSVAYIGGMNVADYYIHGTQKVGEWHDMHCRIEGDEVNTLQQIFLKAWHKVTKQSVYALDTYKPYGEKTLFANLKKDTTATANHKMVGVINREPRLSNKIIRSFYTSVINAAKDSIHLINPYFTLVRPIKKALENAIKRGVKVQILLSEQSDIPLTPDAGFYNAHQLMKKGAEIWIFKKGFHHTKEIMVDGKICTVGSANLNARSLKWDYEANIVIVDKHTTQELIGLFHKEKAQSVLLTPRVWKEMRSPWKRFVGWIGSVLAPLL